MFKIHPNVLILACLFLASSLTAQTYTSWLVGDAADVSTSHEAGIVLAGGGSDNDDAMAWMLNRADGGDVVVLRASGTNGYNNYFFNQLGVTVNSVETIRIPSVAAANDPYVQSRIEEAEVVFIAGGDQTDYYDFWKDTPVETALNYLLTSKNATVGGTSAGMAILGNYYYAPQNLGVTSSEALKNPYHNNMDLIGQNDFLQHPILANTITDTHFDNRSRSGRTFTFLARMVEDWGVAGKAITCNEVTAVCIDETGLAHVYGEHPAYDDYAYFMQVNCFADNVPERCQANKRLWWKINRKVVMVYQVPGTVDGSNTFDLNDWNTGNGGEWQQWWVTKRGQLKKWSHNVAAPNCNTPLEDPGQEAWEADFSWQQTQQEAFAAFPNPGSEFMNLEIDLPADQAWRVDVWTSQGQLQTTWEGQGYQVVEASLGEWADGWYYVRLWYAGEVQVIPYFKQ